MLRSLAFTVALAPIALTLSAPANAQYTTRIEPRPFYGAVVTLEEGVRVIRPLPPERQVIINPNNTPLSLGFSDTNVYERRYVYNKFEGPLGGVGGYRSGGGIPYALPYGYGYRSFGYGGRNGFRQFKRVPGYASGSAGGSVGGHGRGSFKR